MAREPAEISALRRVLGGRLAAFRQAADLTQGQLARVAFCDRTTVVHIEKGRRSADEWFWQTADGTVGAAGALLAGFHELEAARLEYEQRRRAEAVAAARERVAAWQEEAGSRNLVSGESSISPAQRTNLEFPNRRQVQDATIVRSAASPSESLKAARMGRRETVTVFDVEAIREVTRTTRRIDNRFGGGHAHMLAAQYLESYVTPMLRQGRYSERIGSELFDAATQLAHLAAWTAYDIQEHERAQHYFAKALELATATGDIAFGGEILAAMGHQSIHLGRPFKAIELARASQQSARKVAMPALLAEAYAIEANGHALLRDSKSCALCLRQSELAFQRSETTALPEWLWYFDEGYLAARFAHSFRDLKDWVHSRSYALHAVEMSEDLTRAHAFNKALLATAYVEDDPERACAIGFDALELASRLQSSRVVHYLRDIHRRLSVHYDGNPFVDEFTAQAFEVLGVAEWG